MIRAGADFSQMRTEMQRANKDMKQFGSQMRSAIGAIGATLATLGIGTVIKDATELARQVESSMQQVNRTMGTSAQAFTDWANNGARAYNMSKSDAIKYGATYSNLVSGFTANTSETAKVTQDLLKASAIVATSTGRTMADVMDRIRSGMLGETDAVEDLGINVNNAMILSTNAFKKFANGQSWDKLSFQTQQQILSFAILEQASNKYGDAIANNTNSKLSAFTAQLRDIQLRLGQAFLPILNVVLPSLTALASSLSHVMSVFAQFSQALFGKANAPKAAETVGNQAAAVNGLGDAYKDAGKAAKGALAGFDEINKIADPSEGGGAGGADAAGTVGTGAKAGAGEASALDSISAGAQAAADKIRAIWGGISSFITQNKDIIIGALSGIAAGFATFLIATNWAAILAGLTAALNALKISIVATWAAISWPITLIVAGIALLVGAFVYFYRTNETFKGVVDGMLRAIGDAAMWLWSNVLVPMGAWLSTAFVASWNALSIAAAWFWKNVMIPLGNFLVWFWHNAVEPLAAVLGDVLGVAFEGLSDIAKSFWKNVMVPLGNFFKDAFGPTVEALSAVFEWLWKNILEPFGVYLGTILKQIFSDLVKVIEYLWKNVLEPLVEFVGGGLKNTFETVFEGIGKVIDGLKTTLIGVMEFITGVFTGDWGKAWEGVKSIFEGVFKSLYAIVKTPLDLIVDSINSVIDGLNSIKIDLPAFMGGGKFGLNIPRMPKLPELSRGGIVDGATNMGNYIAGEAGAEMIVPLENTSFVDKLAGALGTAVLTAMQMGNGNKGSGDINIVMEGVTVARVIAPFLDKENTRVGGAMITTG